MKKFITILGIITISFHSIIFAQNQKVLLLGECDKEATMNMLNYLNERSKIALTTENNIEQINLLQSTLSVVHASHPPNTMTHNNNIIIIINNE
jgi:hypothetical protein